MSHFFTLICRLITLRINGNSFLPVTKKSADNNYAADVLSCKGCAINPQGCGADEPCTPATVKKPEKSRWLSFNIFRSLQINLAPVAVERPVFAYTTQTCTTTQTNRMKQILRSAKGEGGTLCFAILLMSVFAVQKSNGQTAGPNFAGTGATGGGSGAGWTNPTRVTADDNSYTTVQGTGTAFSEALNSTNFGFSIPSTATINGITVTIGRFSNTAGISDNSVRLLKAGIASGSNLVSGTTWPTSEGAAIYGATNNLWGTTWTPADINNTNFGVALIVSNSSTFTTRTASVDYVQITVSYSVPVPTITSFSPASVCTGGGNPVVITGTNLTGATAVTFNNVAASSFTVNSSTQITATTPATVSTGTIKVTTPGGTATSTTSVTVNPVISGNTLTPTQSSVCSGSSPGQITGSTPTGGSGTYTYAWQSSITSGSSGFGATLSTAQNFTPGSQNQVTWYRRTVTSGGCTDISTAIQITVNPLPQNNINTFNGNTICNGGIGGVGQLTLSIATGTGPYTIVYNDGIADQTVNSYNSGDAISVATNPTVTTNYTLKSITDSKGCTATTGFGDPSATITVNLPPTISVGGNPQSQTICTTRPVTFTTAATGTTPLSYQWRYSADGVNGWTNIGTNSSTFVIPNVASSDVGYYDVVISNSCGSVTSANAQLSVSQTPVLSPVSGFSVVYCNSTALNPVTTNAISFGPSGTGISYHWTNDHPEIGLAASDVGDIASFNPLNSTNAAIVAHITVYAQNDNEPGACQSNTQSFTITVNPAPAVVSNVGTQTLCDGSSKTITFTGTSTLYTYTNISSTIVDIGLPNGTTTSSVTFTGVNSGNAPVTQTYQVVPQYTTGSVTCSGDPITFDIIINPRPTVDALPASQAVCSGASTVSIAISNPNNISGTTYSWTRNNVTGLSGLESGTGALISGAITNSTNGQLTTVYTITATTLDGCSRTTTASVIVNPVASIATINNVEVCTGSTTSAINFSGPVSGTTFEWQSDVDFGFGTGVVSGSNIPAFAAVNGTTDPIVIHIQVTPTANGCAGTPSSFTITVYPAIAEGGISGDQEICASLAPAQLAGSQASGGKGAGSYTYLWESSTTGASSGFTTVAGPSAALQNYTPGVLTQTTWYRRTVISDGCQTSPSTAVKVTVNPRPTAAITTSSANSCAGDNVSLSFNITATSAWTLTLDNGGGSTSGSGSGTFTMNVNPSSTTTYHIASFADSKCSALPAGITGSATLTVKPKPSVVLSTSNSTVCNGSSVTLTAANSGGVNDNSISSGIITLPAGSTSIPNNNAAGRSSTFNVPVHRSLSAASKIIVTISVNHGNVGDLTGTLTGPSGQTIVVFDGGNSNRNFITANTYTFNSTSATAFPPNGTGDIPAGTFVFNSTAGTTFPVSDIFGTWTMKIADQSNTDNSTGAFNSWSIQFASDGAYTTAFNGAGPFGTINYGDAGHTSANVSVTPTVSGDYTATTTDVNGCSGTSNIISLNVNSLTPYTVSGGGVYCDGQGTPDQSIKLSGSTNGVSYTLYKDGSPTAQVLPGADGPLDFGIQTSSGVYTVVGSQGVLPQVCTLTMSGNASVTVNTVPLINSPLADQATCGGSTAIFALDASGSGLTYQWYKGSSPLGNGATGNGSTITGATTATLTISNANVADAASDYNCVVSGCGTTLTSTNAQLIVTAIPVTPPALVSNSPQCASPGVTITSSGTPAANETWYWQTTNNGTSTANPATGVGGSATFVATASGTYYLRGKSDIAACWGNQVSIAVTVNALPADPNPSSITGNVNSCGVVTITRNGGTQNTWYWQGTDPDGTRTDLGTGTTYTQTVTVAQSYTFYLRARNTNGCWSAGSKSVVVNVPAGSTGISNNIITASKTNICYGDPVAFTGTDLGAGVTYQWQFLNVATWTNIPGETGQNYSSAPFTAQATVSYRRHATKGSCSIDSDPVAITITTASTGTGFTDQTVRTPTAILCGPGTVSLSSNGASSVNNWYAEDGTTLLGQTTGTTPISIQVTGENTVVYLEGLSTAPGCVTAAKTPIVITASNLQTQVSASVPAICLTGPSVIPASTLTVTNTNWGVPGTAAKTYAAAKFSTYKTIENATQFPGSANNTSGIALTNAPAGLLLNDSSEIELTLNINAQYAEDLDIFLVDPTGLRAMQVSTDKGPGNSAGHAYWGTVFNTNATTGITFNSTPLPFTGVYRPEGSLIQVPNLSGAATPGGGGSPSYDGVIPAKALVDETGGAPVNGTWTLKVYDDNAQGGAGMLISWSMKIKMKGNDTTTFTSDPATGVVINPLSFIGQSGSADITLPQSAGIYTITASTKDGAGCTTTANKILTVTEPAGITAGPADVTVCENNDAVFSVTTEGGTPHYQWQQSINGTDWTDIGTDVSSLTIPTVTAAMNGYKYHVIVNNTAPCEPVTSPDVTLTVHTEAVLDVLLPVDVTGINSGTPASFSVSASGDESFSYQWQVSHNGGAFTDISDNGTYSGSATFKLDIGSASANLNNNQYRCIVAGSCGGPVTSRAALLQLNLIAQTITFNPIEDKTYGDVFDITPYASASSALPLTFTIVNGPATIDANNMITVTGVGVVTVKASQPGNEEYLPAEDVTQTFNVLKAAVTVTATGGSFTYDGLPKAGSGTATGVNSENLAPVAIHYTGTTNAGDSYDSDDAPSAAGTYTVTATFAGNDTYSSGTDNEPLAIGKAAVTVTATGGSFTYDGLPKAGSGTATGVNSENLAPVAIHYTGTTNAGDSYDSDDAPSAAGTYTVTATFAGNDTYSSGTDNEALTIGKAAVTVTATGGSFTYDGLPKAGSGTATGVNSENLAPVAIHYTGTTNAGDSYDSDDAPSAAGTYTVTATFAGNDTYSSGTDNEALTIGKAAVTVTATGGSFTYDGLPKAGSGTATGVNSENLAPVAIHYTGTTNAGDSYDSDDAPSAAGTYTVTATFAGNDTYSSGTDNEVLTIGKAAVTVTATGGSFTYDGLPKAGSGTATGVNSENLAPVAIHYTGTTNAGDSYDSDDAPSAAGTYTVTATFAGNDTYSSGTDNEVLTIGKAAVTVTATGGSFTYDGLPKAGSGTATGVNSENLAPVAIHYTGTTNAGDSYDSDDAPSAAGTYTVTATFAGNDTYSSGTDNETLTIGKAAVTVTATGGSFTYDGLPKAGSGTATGVNSENLAPVAIHYTGTTNAGDSYDSDDAPSAAGTYTVTATFAGNDTYSSGTDNEVLTIGKAAVTVTATGGSFTYDGLPKAGSGTATGVNSENLAPVAIHYTGTTNAGDSYDSDDAPSAAGTYTVTATFAGNDTYSSGTDNEPLAIGKAAVTITAKSQTKQYGDTFIFTGEPDEFTVEGLEPGDAVTSATLNSAGAPASALANGSPYSIAISNAIGTGLDNYDIQYVPGQLIVNYIPITDVHLAQGVAILCNGGVTTLTVSVTGGDLPLQYKLDDGDYQLGNTFNGVHAGTHTVYVKDADGYTASNSIIITEPDALSATISSQVNAGCGGGTTGSATVGVTGGTAGYTYEWNDDSHQAGATATNLAPGTYIVTVKDANGCTTTATVTITTLAAPVSLGDKTECYSAQTLTAEATAPSGLNVRWYDAPSGGNVIESPTRSSVGTVTYYAASVNEDGCESIQRTAVALTIKALPPAPSSSNTNVQDCYNGNPSQTLTASAAVNGGTVTWYTLASGGSIVENPVQVGVGTVTYYAESVVDGCTSASRTAVSLTIYPAATVLETLPPVITTANDGCTRDYISFTPPTTLSTYCSIPATGVRLNALGQIDLVNTLSSPFPVGTTTIRWEANVNGQLLTSIQQVIVEDKTAPVPNVASLAAVTGQCSAIVTVVPTATDDCAGTISATTSSPLSYTTAGTYTIVWVYSDGHGNTTTQTQDVIISDTQDPVPVTATLPDLTGQCSVTVTNIPKATDNCAGTIIGTTNSPLSYTTPGTYTIVWIYNDGNGNVITQPQTVIVSGLQAYAVTSTGSVCNGGVVIRLGSSQTGVTYQLRRDNNTVVASLGGSDGDALEFGAQTTAGTYTVRAVANAGGCIATMNGSAVIGSGTLPNIYTVAGGGSSCGEGGILDITLSGSQTGVNYQLLKNGFATGALKSGLDGVGINFGQPTETGTYTVLAISGSGCQATMAGSASVTAGVLPTAYAVTGGGSYCSGPGVTVGLERSQNNITYYLVKNGTSIVATQNGNPIGIGLDFGLQTAGTYTVKAYNNITGCISDMTGSAIITLGSAPVVPAITGATSVCPGNTITLSNTTAGGVWSIDLTNIATVNSSTGAVTGVAAGTATIKYTVTNTCGTTEVTMPVTVDAIANAGAIAGASSICVNASETFTASGSGGTWSSNHPEIASVNASTGAVTGVSAGSATITYTVTTGCGSSNTSVPVTVNATVIAGSVTGGSSICAGSSTPFISSGTAGGVWSSDNTNAAIVDANSGVVTGINAGSANIIYTVTGCGGPLSAQKSITITTAATAGTIGGASSVCAGSITPFTTDGTAGGAWSSDNTSVAIVDAATGVVTGVNAGSATITYRVTGCGTFTTTKSITVTTAATAGTIGGASAVCAGLVTPFTTDGTPGGVWSSDNTSVAVVDPSSGVVTGVNAGSAVITYKVIGCGTFTTTKTITVNATVVAGTISGASSVCVGSATSFTSSGTANGAWSSDNTAVAIVNTSGIVTALTPGNATITYTVTGCGGQFSVSKQVTVNATVTAGIVSGASAICATSQTAFTASGTAGGVWSSDNTNAATVDANTGLITGVNAGSANITYTVNGCGGPSVSSKSITVNPSATAGVINGTTDLGCPGSTVQFTTTGTPGGVWSSNHPEIASVSSIGMVTCAGPGDAIITYTVTGCGGQETAQLPVTVTSNAVAGTITGGSLLPICPGSSLVFATDGTTGGVWSSSNTAVATVDETTGEINCIAAGDAMIRYTVNGCSGPVFTEKQVSIAPSVTAGTLSGSSSLCAGSSITLSRSGGVPGGTWISSNPGVATVSNTGVVTGVAAGTVSITYTVTGCNIASTPAKNVTVNASVNAGTMSGPSAVCVGATIQMATNGQSGGTWSSSNTSRATVTNAGVVKGFTAGTVTISYTLSGCGTPVANKQITITASATAGTITGATSVCAGSSITLGRSGGTAGGTWSSSNTTIATVNANGTVTGISGGNVTISYIVGCNSATATKQITISPLVTAGVISGTSNTMCPGSTPTFTSNGTAGGVWSSNHPEFATVNASTGVINCVSAGTVIITYTVNGCGGPLSAQKSITVTTSANAGLVSGTSNTMCSGSTTTFSSNGTPGGTWSSSNTNVATVNANTGLINCVSAGTAMIRYTVNGCSGPVGSTPKAITVASSVTAGTLSGSSSLCAGSTITLSRSGGTAGGTWISSNTNVATVSNTGVVTGVAAGTASITYTVTGCNTASTPAKQVTVNASVNAGIISGASSVCVSSTIQMTTNGQSGGTWSSSNTNRATVNSSGLVRGFAVGTVTISYTLNGCGTPVAQKQITINAAANAGSIAGSSSVCTGSTITLSSNGTSGGAWSSDNTSRATVNSNGVVTGISAGNVTISYKVTGCTVATATKQITVSAALTANNTQIGSNNPVCTGSTITLTAGGGSSYKWSGPNGYTSTQQNPVISNATAAKAGTYSVLISNGNCSITKSVNVTVASAVGGTVLVNGSASANTCYGNTVTISLTGQTGGVTRWEYSTNANSWQTINTNATTITRTVTSNTAFRAIVAINPSCSPTTSSVANVTVTSTGIGGTVSIANSVVCNGSSAVFSLSGNTGSVVRWEYSLNGGFTWTPVNNNTSTSLTYSNATQNRRYRAVVRSCFGNNTVYSTSTAITVINCNSRTTAEAPVTKGTEDALSVATLEATAYPNPSQSYFNLKVKSSNSADVEIKIFDITGKQVGQLKGAAIETFRFGNTLVAGTYIVEVRQGAERVTTKVIKQ